jgi:hypothetical protein
VPRAAARPRQSGPNGAAGNCSVVACDSTWWTETWLGSARLWVYIPAYKNLRDIWIPWSDGLALLGANGAGKSNVLEAFALLLGTEETLRRGRHRFDLRVTGLTVVVRDDHEHMPLSPDGVGAIRFPDVHPGPWADQIRADDEWWAATSADRYAGTPEWEASTVRYVLKSVHSSLDREEGYDRAFSRSLLRIGAGEAGHRSSVTWCWNFRRRRSRRRS